MSPLLQSVAITACLGALLLGLKGIFYRFSRLPLPPGPPKLPLIGNLLQIPSSKEHEVYQLWGKKYDVSRAGVVHADAAGTSLIILNNAKAAWDLLEKRSTIYSSRPPSPMAGDLMGWSWAFGMQPYGESWRARRRAFSRAMNANSAKIFRPRQAKATHLLLSQLLEKPEAYLELLHYHSARIIMSIAYGLEVKPDNDSWVNIAKQAIDPLLEALMPGAFFVDSLPFLKYVPSWFPGAGFKRKARKWKELMSRLLNAPYVAVQQNMESGDYTPSFVSGLLQKLDDDVPGRQERENVVRETAGNMYTAGTDTTMSVIASFIFAMLAAPDVQCKAQEEVDRVAPGRLPTFEDEQSMPYVTAVVWETFRWNNATPIGVPHYSVAEDEYNGYRIPKNSIVISNVWAILHDEDMYPEPFQYKPERYFKPGTTEFDETVQPPTSAAFGFGRRICPGRHLGYASLWIAVASLLKTFNISKARDEQGNIIEPAYEFRSSLVAIPSPFKCSIKPRSAEAERLIAAANDETLGD